MTHTNPLIERVTIIGSGPAGWTAAIYAARANLNPIVFEGQAKTTPSLQLPGGQLMLTTEVENYPGFPEGIRGPEMMAHFKKQAERFGTRVESLDVERCDFSKHPYILHLADGRVIHTHTVIVSTGASAKWLGLPNEMRLAQTGGGVSACAVCDGALAVFRNQPLAVVGGGDTAMEVKPIISPSSPPRFTSFTAARSSAPSKVMQQRVLGHAKAEGPWNTSVADVLGQEKVTGVRIKNHKTGHESTLDVKGLFIAIGHTPNTEFLRGSGLELDDKGYLKLREGFRTFTNIEGVFAAGDVADSIYRQAVTAAAMGSKAAIDAERWLADHGVH